MRFSIPTPARTGRAAGCAFAAILLLPQLSAAASPPVKIEVTLSKPSILPGSELPVEISLLDAANHPAPAPRALEIEMRARPDSGTPAPLGKFHLAAGSSSLKVTVKPPGSGMLYIWAGNPELRPGGAFVRVALPVRQAASFRPQLSARPSIREEAAVRDLSKGAPVGAGIARPDRSTTAAGSPGRMASAAPPAAVSSLPHLPAESPAPIPPPPATATAPTLVLRYSPERVFLADGKDSATVQAFLVDGEDVASSDIRLNLFSSGALNPSPMVIPKGETAAKATVTSANPGVLTVEYLGSSPKAQFEGDPNLHIKFAPPIVALKVQASPPAISLVDGCEVIVTLLDDRGAPVVTDAPRDITFAIQSGRGEISHSTITIPAGGFQARTSFLPVWPGQVAVAVLTPNLLSSSVQFGVSLPVTLLICSLLGGLAGGALSYVKRKKSGKRQLWIGLITGFIFFWACLFLGLASISRTAVLNPIGAIALSTIGGWLQTRVFTAVWPTPSAKKAHSETA